MQFKVIPNGAPTSERGDQLSEVSHYFIIPLLQQVTVVKNQPVAIFNSFLQFWDNGLCVTQSPKGNDFHLNLKHIH